MKITPEQEENSKKLRMKEIKVEEVSADFLYGLELLSEIETLTNGEFLEFKRLLEDVLFDEWCRRFGNPKAYKERAERKKKVDK